ncbi:MAG: carboxypeptidase regulatory-like domain-containing protein [Acidobacteria bacterium]|nr:carboxypeptidase regulatory-like domain-containing protein [Acidobacteriota bacterium]
MKLNALRAVIGGLFFVLLTAGMAVAAEPATLVRLQVNDRAEQDRVGEIINLEERTRGFDLYGWGTPEDLEELERLGYSFEVVAEERDPQALTMCTDPDGPPFEPPDSWNCYPTYSQYVDLMTYYAATYPGLCRLVDLGGTQDGDHRLLALKISDTPDIEEDEPEFFYTATMHGDETAGYVLTLRLAHELLTLYATDSEISGLVDNLVIWINPLANPDGTFAGGDSNVSGSRRGLSNGADPNRSFPDPSAGDDPDAGSWYTEVQAMIDLAEAESFVMSANFHGGAEVVNYPWDVWSARHPDDAWYQTVSHIYADNAQADSPSNYMSGFDDGITNGYDWYQIHGGRQDFMNYYYGCREVTIELSDAHTLDSNQLEAHWGYNRQAMLDFMKEARYGIHGLVTDATSGNPVAATIKVVGHDSETYKTFAFADPDVGDYHRPIEAGTWDLEFSAWGYVSQTVSNINVPGPGVSVLQNVAMVRESDSVSVSGTITDSQNGLPVSGAAVRLTGSPLPAIHSDASGNYVFPSVLAGTYSLNVTAEDYHDGSSSSFSVSAGGDDLDVDLALVPILHITVSGTITDSGTGDPISGATVVFSGPSSGSATSNGSGTYVVTDLLEGSHQVRVSASSYGSIQQTVQLDEAVEYLDFQLDPTTDVLNEDFESDGGGFVATGGWDRGEDATAGAASGTWTWGTVINGYYGVNNADWTLDSPAIELDVDLDSAQLEFAHWFSIEPSWDGGHVLVSSNGGASFQLLTPDGGYPDDDVEGLDNQPGYTGSSSGWETATIDLGTFIGQTIIVRFRFGTDSSENDYQGWYIDDVRVLTTGGTPPEPPLFADGFESGDTNGWDSTVGGS